EEVGSQALDGRDARVGDGVRDQQARARGLIVDEHGAGAALALTAALLGPREAEAVAKVIDQPPAVPAVEAVPHPVDLDRLCRPHFSRSAVIVVPPRHRSFRETHRNCHISTSMVMKSGKGSTQPYC